MEKGSFPALCLHCSLQSLRSGQHELHGFEAMIPLRCALSRGWAARRVMCAGCPSDAVFAAPGGAVRALSGQASSDLDAFRRIVGRRTSASSFSSATVRPEVLMDCFRLALVRSKWEFQCNHRYRNLIVHLTQRAPSSFNAQPFRFIVVRDRDQREKLADAMLGQNQRRVSEAPVAVVVAADLGTPCQPCAAAPL